MGVSTELHDQRTTREVAACRAIQASTSSAKKPMAALREPELPNRIGRGKVGSVLVLRQMVTRFMPNWVSRSEYRRMRAVMGSLSLLHAMSEFLIHAGGNVDKVNLPSIGSKWMPIIRICMPYQKLEMRYF